MPKIMVVGLESGPLGADVLRTALDVAGDTDDCEVHAIHVGVDDSYGADADARTPRELEHLRATVMSAMEDRESGWREPRVFVHAAVGDPAKQITRLAQKLRSGLVVVGTHTRSTLDQLMVGSVAARVLQKVPCSVLVVRPPNETQPSRGVDPDCADCLEVRALSRRTTLFCERHADGDVYVEAEPRRTRNVVVASR
jgi:nucleotide-binding universal stress UspA family protein